jgi:XTP/dITP diphosphohydrolase
MNTASALTGLVLATGNPGKVRELREIFGKLPLELRTLEDFPDIEDVAETGATFAENADLKASGFALQTGEFTLADDSGLEIEAIGNAPGVHSARFAGTDTGYDVKIERLFTMMRTADTDSRRARFVCAMALADARGRVVHTVEAECVGTIALEPSGTNGFGYDPIFIPEGHDKTFAELSDEVKRSISHRAKAAELIIRYLLDFIAGLT